MGKILCVCISEKRKSSARNVHQCTATRQGLMGDVHYGMTGRKQVSLLPYEKVKPFFDEAGQDVLYGRFGENLLAEGLSWEEIREGSRLLCGDVLLEVVKIGAGGPASDAYKGEKVCSPMEPYFIFCQILKEGVLRENQEIEISA